MIYIYAGGFLVLALSTQIEIKPFKIWKWKNK
jgi:hypothetical protein